MAITIWSAFLLSDWLLVKLESYYSDRTYSSVLLGMAAVLAIYFPILTFLDKYIQRVSREYVKGSKNIVKNSFYGLLLGFLVAFLILFILFARQREQLDVMKDIMNLF
jgi:uncharacterized protein YacL